MSDHPTCETCRFWGVHNWHLDHMKKDQPYQHTDREHMRDHPHKPCGCPKIVDSSDIGQKEVDAMPSDMAVFSDCEGYSASFVTGPNFGCIHHEPKG